MYTILGYLWQYVTNPKAIIALSLFVALVSSYNVIPRHIFWALFAVYVLGLIVYGIYWLIQRRKHAKQGEELAEAIERETESEYNKNKDKEELQLINQQMKESIQLIRKSKLGDKKGNAALYELPWYMVIGNPAAGKSSAIYNSGLKFPFEETHQKMVSAGLSGTRNCDWFFSTEGVLLDTAGRYSVYAEDHDEWIGFLNLLKKNRSKAPVNGLILIVSIAELVSQSPEKSLKLAKNLRARIQDLTERLEIFAPVYLVFTKMDLIAGFTEFFECYEDQEFDQVWGATLPYNPESSQNAIELFEQHYNILYDGLKSVSTTHLSRRHAQNISPSVMTFPLEFKTLKPALKTFIGTLFEENPYQFKPVFRGFYFTSALQEGVIESPMTEQIAQEFQLAKIPNSEHGIPKNSISQNHGYFLKGLFSDVILKDKNLVKQHINPNKKRQRYLGFIAALLGVSIILGVWVWSYRNNQQLIADVQADLNKVVQMEKATGNELSTQLDALLILQQRLQQLDDFDQHRPLKFSFGLYQGNELREKLKIEYLKGIKQIVLTPTQQNIAQYLQRVKNNEETLKANHVNVEIQQTSKNKSQQYLEPSDTNPQDAYNALKAYLMMSNPQYMDSSHLSDQVTRFWRSWLDANRGQMPRGDMIQKAEQILSYSMTLANDKYFPVLESDSLVVDQTRQVLLSVVRGMPARDRVYNEIKMRAAVRYPALTVSQIVGDVNKTVVLGSYALPGVFTQKAWDDYVATAIDEAANKPTDSKDWVLNSTQSDDLTFSGSPDQIRKQLTQLYKQEYIAEWKKFLNAVHYAKNTDFAQEAKVIDILGEPQNSPIRTLLDRVAKETSWDNPVVQAELAAPQTGFIAWFKRTILRQGSEESVKKAMTQAQGPISQEFSVFYQLVRKRDDQQNKSLLDEYLTNLSQIRSKFNDLKNAGDIGPSAMTIVKQTISEQSSVFNTTQKVVDEKLSVGLNEADQQMVQKLLVSPLTQAFESLLIPAQNEINKLWVLQAYQPFNQTLSQKYPFNSSASIQATSGEIGQIFGESGSIARFVKETLDPLVIRRGYTLTSKTWKDLGISLNPQFVMGFQNYVAPANGVATGDLNQPAAPAATNQSNFQFYPLQNPKLLSYSIEIDGQRMVYENGIQQWVNFIWPNSGAIPGARITAVDLEGQTHTIFEAPGEYGINRLIDSAQRKQQNGSFEMVWTSSKDPALSVKVNFRLISGNSSSSVGSGRGYAGLQLVDKVVTDKAARVVAAETAPIQTSTQTQTTTPTVTQPNTATQQQPNTAPNAAGVSRP
ncbi:type VI secretion system membrane subunit TssM [Acinetobacter stercoris]|uniref:Intracellular multiplication and human macrophage-killing n=1 Tax=Acinetobacter stercoris TaxID=2126983 RepID=A0A2U3MWA8_9GAMM|nr:type VI secretion system membrane subunit TssM [Acinetobacter stercoris]SPL69710.1 Intracellular multiplication and human macrophage-killing [Acinetobacter stercoris]